MKISIVTPVYNDPRVARALDSILEQEHDGELELVVIDGGSTDGTLEVLSKYRDHLDTLVSECDDGIYDAMNKGVARTTGDIVGILNADDQYTDLYVLRDVLTAFQDSNVEACYGDLVYVDDTGRVVRYWRSGACRPVKFYLGWMPPHPTFFVRRGVYERHGVFNPGYPIAADYELMLRLLLKHRVAVNYLPRVMVKMGLGGRSNRSLSGIASANVEVFRAWRDNELPWGLFVPFLKLARKPLQYAGRRRGSQGVTG